MVNPQNLSLGGSKIPKHVMASLEPTKWEEKWYQKVSSAPILNAALVPYMK